MLRLLLICLTNNGIIAARIVSVRPMIARAHEADPAIGSKTPCQTSRIALTRKYSGVRMKPPMSLRNSTQTPWVIFEWGGTGS